MTEALFEPLGDGRFRPGPHTRGPWDPDAQHGGAPAALIGREVERTEPGAEMRIARVTLELLRPVPLTDLRVETEIVRPGRRVQLVEARVHAEDALVVRALALRIRREPGAAPEVAAPAAPPPGPDGLPAPRFPFRPDGPSFARTGVEIRYVAGGWEPGPATTWIALRAPVVPGEEPSGVQRALAAADFGNGVSSVLDWDAHVFINPDLTVHLARDPVGAWVCLDAATTITPDGTGQAASTLYDARGELGRAVQALYVAQR